ncbi:putative fad binding domain-containing protein [Botrytis fragariae]|uniref:Putative fad binding domain-containing protein n=1 Tax=Botrytis fragariae TaxID=1964551 RepID=A0A8H6AZU1_9HELO|nr:putative fad binding domain-containing protein [Botrytis fragariae]KAF5876522.1 putative fad binding domain-containing protein [Botrytis fragariae]
MIAVARHSISPSDYAISIDPYDPNLSDHLDFACAKGDFRPFSLTEFPDFKSQNFMKGIEIYKELLATCPDTGAAGHVLEWHTRISKLSPANWAFGNEHVHLRPNCVAWYHGAENHDIVLDFENNTISAMRDGHAEEDWVDCVNCNRTDPVQR